MRFRDTKFILSLVIVISLVGTGVYGDITYRSNKLELAQKDAEISSLQSTVNQVGQLVTAYKLNTSMQTGQQITSSDLSPITVPYSLSQYLVTNTNNVVGEYIKEDTSSGSPLLKDNVGSVQIARDSRLYDVVLDEIPVGLKVGDYVDIRISLPLGQDYVGISHVRVYAINDSVLKIDVSEKDLLTYKSMLIDSLIYPGTQIYATQYVEGMDQTPAISDYPLSTVVLAVAERDPNLLTAIQSNMINRRNSLVKGLNSAIPPNTNQQSVQQEITQGMSQYQSIFDQAVNQYQQSQAQLQSSHGIIGSKGAPLGTITG